MKVKQDGSVLLPTIIISAMLLALAMSLTKIVSNEVQFSADLLLGERAYFAAESGVEGALLYLKEKPINVIELKDAEMTEKSKTSIAVKNKVYEFPFVIKPFEVTSGDTNKTRRWRLGLDTDPNVGVVQKAVRDLVISDISNPEYLQWKIQCATPGGTTKMIQGYAYGSKIDASTMGRFDNAETITSMSLGQYLADIPQDDNDTKCHISLTNFGTDTVSGKVSSVAGMSPAQTYVRAHGESGGREKIIEFEYRQKNLAPFFDFGLLHSN